MNYELFKIKLAHFSILLNFMAACPKREVGHPGRRHPVLLQELLGLLSVCWLLDPGDWLSPTSLVLFSPLLVAELQD